jgi:SAM-dependent methyltransferase
MTKSEIISKWIELGWTDANAYHESIKLNQPIIKEFDADLINPKTFWAAADENFATDPVANSNTSGNLMSITESNRNNHLIALDTGMYSQLNFALRCLKHHRLLPNIAEIGCGYGSFREHFIKSIGYDYTGFDIIQRHKDAYDIMGDDGTFSEEQVAEYQDKFNIFYSANVFQHLSPKQIQKYLEQVYEMLPYRGLFNLMYVHDCNTTYHYGQSIKIIGEKEIISLIKSIGYRIMLTSKMFIGHLQPMCFLLEK